MPDDRAGRVVLTPQGFLVGTSLTPVLKYQVGESGWTNELTKLHQSEAGSDHYIDIASRNHALSRVKRWVAADDVIMEIGCSSGHMLRAVKDSLPVSTSHRSRLYQRPLGEFDPRASRYSSDTV